MTGPGGAQPVRLPAPSTSSLVLLWLSVGATALFAGHWALDLRPGGRPAAHQACVSGPGPADAVGHLLRCTDRVAAVDGLTTLAAAAVVVPLAGVVYLAVPVVLRRRHRARRADPAGPLAATFARLAAEAGLSRVPRLEVGGRGLVGPGTPITYGHRWPYRVLVPMVMELDAINGSAVDRALLRHELAHVRARDVSRVYLALSAWAVSVAVVALPLGFDAVRHLGATGAALASRLVVLAVLLYLALLSVVRQRELEADVAAGSAESAPVPARPGRTGVWRFHPGDAHRGAVLAEPELVWRPAVSDGFVAGLGGGLFGTEVSLLLDSVTPLDTWWAYLFGAAVTAAPVTGVVGMACWRAALLRRWAGRTPLLGVALGAGLLVGAQIAPRATTDWWRVFATAGGTASRLGLGGAPVGSVLLIAGSALATGVLTTLTCAAGAVAWSRPDRARPLHVRVGFLVGVVVLTVPLGTWLLVVRLAAGSGWDASTLAWVTLTDVRSSALVGVAVLAVAHPMVGLARGRARSPSPPLPPAWRATVAGVLALAGAVTALVAAHRGDVPGAGREPAGRVQTRPPPLPSTTQAGYACLWFQVTGPATLAGDRTARQLFGRHLTRVDDPVLRDIGRVLADPAGPSPAPRAAALTALTRRCDILLRFGTPPSAPR
jgi:hypothetical protein